jgi:ElaB/YqjD/DUF883 family membrane-anchored ribosome-binding protein
MTDQKNKISATFVQHTKSKQQHLIGEIKELKQEAERTIESYRQHTKSERQHLIGEIKELKKEAEQVLENYRQEILNRTTLILSHAEEYSSSEDEDEYEYSTIHRVRRDKKKMSSVVELMYELEVPLHPYCDGCNREHGGPHPGQRQHMGVNGCINTD